MRCSQDSTFFLINIFFTEVELMYNAVLISAVQQSDSVIHTHSFFNIFFSMMVYRRILNIVLCDTQ